MKKLGILVLALVAVFIGWSLLPEEKPAPQAPTEGAQAWTCSMHPQVRQDHPGRCPICGMDLTPAAAGGSGDPAVALGEGARRMASIEVEPLRRLALEHGVRTVGKIEAAEPRVSRLSARVDGRIERLYVDFTGIRVSKGDHLVDLYSPDLVLAQTELLLAARHRAATPEGAPGRSTAEAALEAARRKLLLWGVTEGQVEGLLQEGKSGDTLTLHAPVGGVVIEKNVRQGTYVKTGDPLYTIADLSTLWVHADVYEYELPWVEVGQEASLEAEGAPGRTFSGTVAFVEPTVTEATRTVRVRINLPNPDGRLKPGMFAKVLIRARLGADGRKAPSPLAGKFACPMHPEAVSEAPGACRICGMPLEKVPGEAPAERIVYTCSHHGIERDRPGICELCGTMELVREVRPAGGAEVLAVPASAVLDTGVRTVVYVELEPGRYAAREVVLGPKAGGHYPVLSGLAEGERVVVRGNFLLDSQAQIEGKPSLLLPKGLEKP